MTGVNIHAWCADQAAAIRDMEEHEMAMYPTEAARDQAIVEWTVRVLANADLPESRAVLDAILAQWRKAGVVSDTDMDRLATAVGWDLWDPEGPSPVDEAIRRLGGAR